jgi:CheY-like chemotaxis protein
MSPTEERGREDLAPLQAAAPGDRVDILIVDDTAAQRMAVESVLSDLGENVVAVDSGREALRYLLDHDVAVILLDVNMPEMDGFETAALVRQRPRTRNVRSSSSPPTPTSCTPRAATRSAPSTICSARSCRTSCAPR